MKAGDTFLIPLPGTSLDSHLWVVISDPDLDPTNVLIVNFTTLRADSDTSCILNAGDHPFIKHDTCVSYRGAKVVSVTAIARLLASGQLKNHSPVSANVLGRIRQGAANSPRMSLEHADILIEQNLLDC